MANRKSAIARLKTTEKARIRNREYKSQFRSAIRKMRSLTNFDEAQLFYKEVTSTIDRMVSKGIIHRNKGANQKSKLAHFVQSLSA